MILLKGKTLSAWDRFYYVKKLGYFHLVSDVKHLKYQDWQHIHFQIVWGAFLYLQQRRLSHR